MEKVAGTGTPDLIVRVRAGFVMRGTSMTAWAKANAIDVSAVRQALLGTWAGPKGRALKARILAESGVQEAA